MNSDWTTAKIEEIAEVNPRLGKTDISDDLMVSFVPMPAVGAGDSSIDVTDLRPFGEVKKGFTKFQEGDVLFAKITPCMENGKMAVVPKVSNGYGFGSTEFHVLRPKEGIDARYLYYYVSSRQFRGAAERNMTGAVGQKRVPTKYLKEQEIPIAPLEQQTRIVAEIEKQFSRLDEAVANLKRVKANLNRYKAAVLKAAVEGKLTEEWRKQNPDVEPADKLLERIFEERRANWQGRGKYKEPVAPDTSGLPELPEGWVWARSEQITDFITKGTTPAATKLHVGQGDVQFLKVYNLTFNGDLNYNYKPVFVDSATHQGELARSKVFSGDVLINIVGPPLGQVSVVPSEIEEANINQAIARFRPFAGLNKFLALSLMTESIMAWAVKRAKTTAGQSNLTLELCRDLPIPLPPLAEQLQIVAEVERHLSIIADAKAQIEANLRRADRLRQSILKKAFSGQLVPQDPDDEPAKELLELIRANADGAGATRLVARKRSAEGGRGSAVRRCDRPNP